MANQCLRFGPEKGCDPSPQSLETRDLVFLDASQAAEAQFWVPINYRQLSAGELNGRMEVVDLPDMTVFHECHDQSLNKSGVLPPGQCTLSFIDRGHRDARFCQFYGADGVFFQPEQHEFDILMPGGQANTYARIDQQQLIRALQILDVALAEQLARSRSLQYLGFNAKARLSRAMHQVLALGQAPGTGRGGADPDGLRATLMEQILLAITASDGPLSGDAPQLHGRRRTWRMARAAREFLEDCLHRGITPGMVDLCAHLRVSERTLRYVFREWMGCPPGAYLRRLRLNGVRAELLAPGPATTSVTAVATRWGFLEMGHFSRDYRTLFHEKPSVTLTRALTA
ncbi:transcriptional regulator EutR [Thiorhodovibrio winogradskyi]|uniref:Transcriptional regulator EutR n=1 Tax=Thiorhodovibrio winogradskyi TaxID=77007 RepID=A0ABZ0S898_9GAMM|nr:helix-turn-helix domain-containing protein [Thiorhodovibrio winogradskyi]